MAQEDASTTCTIARHFGVLPLNVTGHLDSNFEGIPRTTAHLYHTGVLRMTWDDSLRIRSQIRAVRSPSADEA